MNQIQRYYDGDKNLAFEDKKIEKSNICCSECGCGFDDCNSFLKVRGSNFRFQYYCCVCQYARGLLTGDICDLCFSDLVAGNEEN